MNSVDTKTLLSVQDLTIAFGALQAVSGVNFNLRAGKTLALVGESGCGKSLTAHAMLGLLPPAARVVSGQALFEGQDLLALPDTVMRNLRGRRMGMIFQEPMTSLNPVMRIGRQITEVLERHQMSSGRAARKRATELLDAVRIADPERRLDHYPHELSGGMRQRVMIAIAMACDPAVLIADEPTTALDVTVQAEILGLIKALRLRAATSVLLITHDLGVVADAADRVAVMYAGRIVETGPVAEILRAPRHPYTIGLIGAIPRLGRYRRGTGTRLLNIEGTVPGLGARPNGCAFAPRCRYALPACREGEPPLHQHSRGRAVACLRADEDLEVAQ